MRMFLVTLRSKTDPCAHCDIAKRQSKGTSMREIVCPFLFLFFIRLKKKKVCKFLSGKTLRNENAFLYSNDWVKYQC